MNGIIARTLTGPISRALRGGTLAIVLVAGLAPHAALSVSASAQGQAVTSVTAYFAVVDKDEAIMRAGGNELMYGVAKLPRGTVLRVDGETKDVAGQGWSRVSYPLGSYVFVPVDAVTLDASGTTGTLSKLARVKAPNQATGISGSWSDAMPQALGAGTKVTLLSAEQFKGTSWTGYQIAPPEAARAYVPASSLRRASQDEINAFMARAAQGGTSIAPTPAAAPAPATADATPKIDPNAPAVPETQPTTPPSTTTATNPATNPAAGTPSTAPAGGTNLAEPMAIPAGAQPAVTIEQKPVQPSGQPVPRAIPEGGNVPTTTPSESKPATTPAPTAADTKSADGKAAKAQPADSGAAPRVTPGGEPRPAAPAKAQPANPYEELEAAMAEIRKQPIETADYTGLIARYEAEIAKLDDTPANRMFRGRLQQRLLWLQGAVEAQNVRKKLAESSQAVAASQSSIGERMADVARNRQYSIVGRLTTSTVYDGQRLPRMYRIQAVGGGPSPRTLGYLKPDAMPGLESKIGQVVGVVGSAKIDSALGLNVITPSRVDVLEAAQVPGAQPPSAPPAAPPASQPTTPPGN